MSTPNLEYSSYTGEGGVWVFVFMYRKAYRVGVLGCSRFSERLPSRATTLPPPGYAVHHQRAGWL